MNKKILLPVVVALMCLPFAGCSDSDGDDDSVVNAVDFPIPSSVVDGVRISEIENLVKIEYAPDGSIEQATYNGKTFHFEYEQSRAVSTGRKLERVWYDYEDDGELQRWEAINFNFDNFSGFATKYLEKIEYTFYDYHNHEITGKSWVNNQVNIDYNQEGRISAMHLSWDDSGYDLEDGEYKMSVNGMVNYNYIDGVLESSTLEAGSEKHTWKFEYDENLYRNVFNIITPYHAAGMANYSPIAMILALSGHLGHASSLLPVKMTYYEIDTDPDYPYQLTEEYTMTYQFNENASVSNMTMLNDRGDELIFNLQYEKHLEYEDQP